MPPEYGSSHPPLPLRHSPQSIFFTTTPLGSTTHTFHPPLSQPPRKSQVNRFFSDGPSSSSSSSSTHDPSGFSTYERDDQGVGIFTLTNPAKRNPLNLEVPIGYIYIYIYIYIQTLDLVLFGWTRGGRGWMPLLSRDVSVTPALLGSLHSWTSIGVMGSSTQQRARFEPHFAFSLLSLRER